MRSNKMTLAEAKEIANSDPISPHFDKETGEITGRFCHYCGVANGFDHYPFCDWMVAKGIVRKEKTDGFLLYVGGLPDDKFKTAGGRCKTKCGVYHLAIIDMVDNEEMVQGYIDKVLDLLESIPGSYRPSVARHGLSEIKCFTFYNLTPKQVEICEIAFGKDFDACL